MRHLKRNAKLGRKGAHRNAMLANMVCSLITHKRVTTTLAKAKAVRPVAEKMVTLGKKGSIHHRRLAVARLHQEGAVKTLFTEIAPQFESRQGGYTRIIKLGDRRGDASPMAIIEFVESGAPASATGGKGKAKANKKEKAPSAEAVAAPLAEDATAEETGIVEETTAAPEGTSSEAADQQEETPEASAQEGEESAGEEIKKDDA